MLSLRNAPYRILQMRKVDFWGIHPKTKMHKIDFYAPQREQDREVNVP